MKITVGEEQMPDLDPQRLNHQEMAQVGKLLEQRARLQVQLKMLEQELHVALLAAKERRGLLGLVTVDCLTGEIAPRTRNDEE